MLFSNAAGSLFALASLALSSQAGLIYSSRDASPKALGHRYANGESRAPIAGRAPSPEDFSEFKATEASLDKRMPKTKMVYLSDYENAVLRYLAERVQSYIDTDDLVLFVGNSGSYMIYPFAEEGGQGNANLWSIPVSKTKYYGVSGKQENKGVPNKAGLDNFWDRVLKQRVDHKAFDRIVLVDHSSTGKSVDGFRKAFVEVISRAYEKKKINHKRAQALVDVPMKFINVVDWRRRPGNGQEATPPVKVGLLATVTCDSAEGVIDTILADKDKHPRVACEYYPRRWYKTVKDCWEKDGGFENAKHQRTLIKQYNEQHGGLLTVQPPANAQHGQAGGQNVVEGFQNLNIH